jgi:hypothetical protein
VGEPRSYREEDRGQMSRPPSERGTAGRVKRSSGSNGTPLHRPRRCVRAMPPGTDLLPRLHPRGPDPRAHHSPMITVAASTPPPSWRGVPL